MLGPPRAQGRWSLVARDLGLGLGPGATRPDPTESAYTRVTMLLERHGVLTREAVRAEGIPGGFAGIYPLLRAMEEAGRIRRGYFVAGLGGAQFALPGAVDRLRASRGGVDSEGDGRVLVLAATDPANPYGMALSWPAPIEGGRSAPPRVAGAYVVLVDGEPTLYLERGGKGLSALRPSDGDWEEPALAGLVGLLDDGRLRRLTLQRWPGELEPALLARGFVRSPKGLVRYA